MIRRFKRAFTSYSLVLLQVHLLGVAMLHHHGETPIPGHAPWVQAESPTVDNSLPCTACQIVRHSAVQPASTAPVLQSAVSVPLPPRLTQGVYRSLQPAISYGRAPPLV